MKLMLPICFRRKTKKKENTACKTGHIAVGKRVVVTPSLYSVSGASFLGPFVFRKTK